MKTLTRGKNTSMLNCEHCDSDFKRSEVVHTMRHQKDPRTGGTALWIKCPSCRKPLLCGVRITNDEDHDQRPVLGRGWAQSSP